MFAHKDPGIDEILDEMRRQEADHPNAHMDTLIELTAQALQTSSQHVLQEMDAELVRTAVREEAA